MVYHVFTDGSVKTEITGHIVKLNEAGPVYDLLTRISQKPLRKRLEKEDLKNEKVI